MPYLSKAGIALHEAVQGLMRLVSNLSITVPGQSFLLVCEVDGAACREGLLCLHSWSLWLIHLKSHYLAHPLACCLQQQQ